MPRRTEGPCGGKRSATLAISIVVALTTLTAAPAGQAGPLVASADGCTNAPLEQPFVRWLDVSPYVLVADGGFENGASGWSLSGAGVVDGNEPYHVHGADESKSLSISSGGSATSATTCVGLEEPTLRLFMRSSDASPLSMLKVEVLFEDALGTVRATPIGVVPALASTSWNPFLPMTIGANLLPLIDGKTPVRFRFTAEGSADWQIDDVYVDPRYH